MTSLNQCTLANPVKILFLSVKFWRSFDFFTIQSDVQKTDEFLKFSKELLLFH